jgi:hypothetical protein
MLLKDARDSIVKCDFSLTHWLIELKSAARRFRCGDLRLFSSQERIEC